jgi:hypothetical protein
MGLFNFNLYRVGEPLAMCKTLSNYEESFPHTEWTVNLLGDPAMPLWTDIPTELVVTHIDEMEAVATEFTVHVEDAYGTPVESALVCLWNDWNVYERVLTDNNGDVVLTVYPTVSNPVLVTVTGQNLLPYPGEVQVIGNVPPQCIAPIDTSFLLCGPEEIFVPVGCFDPDGNFESGPHLIDGPGQIVDDIWSCFVAEDDSIEVTIRCIDSMSYYLDTTFLVVVNINEAPTLTVPGDTSVVHYWRPSEIVRPIAVVDENFGGCLVVDGPGCIDGDFWRCVPDCDYDCDVVIRASDTCGEYDEKSFHLDYTLYLCGDIDDDDAVNILDILRLIDFLYNQGPPPEPYYIANADGIDPVNILDIAYLINYLYNDGPEPVCME